MLHQRKLRRIDARRRLSLELFEGRRLLAADGLTIYAAGDIGTEDMSLLVDDQVVQSWSNIGGDMGARQFESYEYLAADLALDRIKIAFTNDIESAPGSDLNLNVDRLNLYGVDYEIEAANTFSVGSWNSSTGCDPGFKRSETLHCDGYFEFPPVAYESTIEIRAAGATGEEDLELRIDGVAVATWQSVAGDFDARIFESLVYQHPEAVDANQIQVAFTNDGLTAQQQDKNLRVDGITVDGVVFESEDPGVLSTGTWTADSGCGPGFKQSEVLACNGFFQYAPGTTPIEIRAAGATGTEQIELQIDRVPVATWDNVAGDYSGRVFETFQYLAAGTIVADQVRVVFSNDAFLPGGADRNVRVDGITVGDRVFESESDTVFSTGTWSPVDGCSAGFKQSEFLQCGGYLQFAEHSQNRGGISLATNNVLAGEADGPVDIVIERNGGAEGIITVDYRSLGGTATAGSDFSPVSGRAIFQDGETTKVISIDILQDVVQEGTERFSFSIDNVNGGASLLAPRTAIVTIQDDESPPGPGAGFAISAPDFSQVPNLTRNGSAAIVSDRLRLTPAADTLAGSAFYDSPIEFGEDTSFSSNFEFAISGGDGTAGGHGLTFVLQNVASGVNAVGGTGAAQGFGGIGAASLAIEFDTVNDPHDESDNQLSILLAGDVANPLETVSSPIDLNGAPVVFTWIDYVGASDTIQVFLSETGSKPATPLLESTVDLFSVLGDQAFFGFSAGTGVENNAHDILSWSFAASSDLVSVPPIVIEDPLISGLAEPTAIEFSADGRNLFIAEKGGLVRVARDGQLLSTPVIDIQAQVNSVRDRGLMDIALHPDLAHAPYLYLLYTYDPPEVNNYTGLAGPDGIGNRAGRLTRVELDPGTNYTTAVAGTEVVLLGANSVWENYNGFANSTVDFDEPPAGILPDGTNLNDFLAADSESHTVGAVEFGTDGALYVSNGDGTSYNQMDPRTVRVQDIDNLSGKVLRIDPITGEGLEDNPFYITGSPNANRSKVFQYGLRNPFRMVVDKTTSRLFIGEVGWTQWEEINQAAAGANFGWPYYEGASGTSARTIDYQDLPEAQAFYASGSEVTPSLFALNHLDDGIDAIVAGDIYIGDQYPAELQGDLFVNDLGQGIVRNISFGSDGEVTDVDTFVTGADFVVQMKSGPDGLMYYVDLVDGIVGRWVPQVESTLALDGLAAPAAPTKPADGVTEDDVPRWRAPAFDTSLDGVVSPLDALLLVNHLNRQAIRGNPRGKIPPSPVLTDDTHRFDVDGDGYFSARDLLLIVNHLNAKTAQPKDSLSPADHIDRAMIDFGLNDEFA